MKNSPQTHPPEKWKISKLLPAILHNNPSELMSTSTGSHETNTNSRTARVKIAYFAKIRSSRSEFSQNASHSSAGLGEKLQKNFHFIKFGLFSLLSDAAA